MRMAEPMVYAVSFGGNRLYSRSYSSSRGNMTYVRCVDGHLTSEPIEGCSMPAVWKSSHAAQRKADQLRSIGKGSSYHSAAVVTVIDAQARARLDELKRQEGPNLYAELCRAVHLLRRECDPGQLGGERFDLTDCVEMEPIFRALARAEGR